MTEICGIKNKTKTLLVLMILFFINIITANADSEIKFKNIGIEDGLSQSTVETIFQDSRGYIWIGTNDGLNKFNGHEFNVYKYGEDKTKNLSSGKITDIVEDKDGYIWIATSDGVNRLDPKDDSIVRYMDESSGGSLSNFNITQILITKKGDILVATTDGLNLYDEENDKFTRILGGEEELTNQFIYSLNEDYKGNIWVGTSGGLNKISKEYKPIKQYKNGGENSISESSVYNTICDKEYIWVSTEDSGLIKINTNTDEIKVYTYNEIDENSIPSNNIRSTFIDKNNNLWVGTYNGLAKYNEESDDFQVYISKLEEKDSLINSKINDIMQDDEGLIWIGTYNGISIFDPDNKIQHYKLNESHSKSITSNSIHGIYEDDEGLIWIGTNTDGINILDRSDDSVIHIDEDNGKYKLSNYAINDIVGIGDKIYIATREGLNEINKKDNSVVTYNKEDGLESNFISELFIDSKGYLWIGNSEGLNIMNTKDNKIINISEDIKLGTNINRYVKNIYEDSEGDYYIGLFRNEGLLKITTKDKSIKQYKYNEKDKSSISNNYIRSIVEDNNGDLWIGTSYGLNKFDKKTEKFTRYTSDNGLANDTIYGLLVDGDNNIWASTNRGISKVDTKNEKFQNFTVLDGLQSNEFNGNASYKTKDGNLIFGGINGINIINPKEIGKNDFNPGVVFERVKINGEDFEDIKGKTLKYNENSMVIEFFVPKYNNDIEYYYKLEGITSTWEHTDTNKVRYYQLEPGNYKFRIIPKYSSGEFGQEKTLEFKINPPFWKSKIAIVLYIIIIIALIYINKNKVKRLDKLVNKRTKQLTDEMERSNELLNQVIKLEQNKNNYFVNLSHELRTPLNVISSTNQLIKELNKSDKSINKEKLGYYMEISNKNCKRLLNLINNIIDSTKLQSENYIITLKQENIVEIVEEATLSLVEFAKSKGVKLIIDPQIEEGYIECDAYEIDRCIVNLVSNAIKFTPEGGQIDVTIENENSNIVIKVKDTGVGIDTKYQESIFNRFNQVIDSNNEIKGGSGLGLTITKQIIDLHKGTISVESELNKGSNFIITLPIEE